MAERCSQQFMPSKLSATWQCARSAKVSRDGKWFCWQHDPQAIKKRGQRKMDALLKRHKSRQEQDQRESVCAAAFESPDGRSIPTELIQEGLVFEMRDLIEEAGEVIELLAARLDMPTESSQPKADADSLGSWSMLQRMRALLSSLQPKRGE